MEAVCVHSKQAPLRREASTHLAMARVPLLQPHHFTLLASSSCCWECPTILPHTLPPSTGRSGALPPSPRPHLDIASRLAFPLCSWLMTRLLWGSTWPPCASMRSRSAGVFGL